MRLQTKITLSIIPMVLSGIIVLGMWSLEKSKESIHKSNLLYMNMILDSYLADVNSLHNLLVKNRLDKVESFLTEYKQKAFKAGEDIQISGTSHIFIIDESGQLVFCSAKSDKNLMETVWGPVAQKAVKSSESRFKLHVIEEGIDKIYVARHFKPWRWIVFFAMRDKEVHSAEVQIRNATIGIAIICSLSSILLIMIIFRKFFVVPIHIIGKSASAIAKGESVKKIAVFSKDELGDLARNMESMSNAIQKHQAETKKARDDLEKRVEERTSELIEANRKLNKEIADHQQAEVSLAKSEDRFRTIFEQSPLGIALIDSLTGEIYEVNPKFTEIASRTLEEMINVDWMSMTHPDDVQEDLDNMALLNAGKITGFNMNKRYIRPDDSYVWINMTIAPAKVEDKTHPRHLCMIEDITDRKKLESRLQQAQKMETIGTLAGGIAHDFNNILFPIVGYTEMLLADSPKDSPLRSNLNEIFNGAMRAKDLTKQILTFSRQDSIEIELMRMQPIVREALKLIRSTIPTSIEIKQTVSHDCGVIKADPTQIHQIVMNLATNAYHAMEDTGGELKVGLKEVELGEQDVINLEMEPGLYACLTVADTGTGMNKDLTDKIFDPFFTTKENGKGTGMGLSVVHGIVNKAGGFIHVDSEPGKGTEFHVYLPVEMSSSKQQETQTKAPIQRGTEQILLVDDEAAIVFMEKQMLERLGYSVASRTSSVDALEAFRENPDKFDLVITDMAMPNMNGNQLASELIKIRPDIPILLCTGFSEKMPEEKTASLGIKGFLMKPIVRKDLANKIREVLDNKESSN
jgi:PAS domain S-box-containing protein